MDPTFFKSAHQKTHRGSARGLIASIPSEKVAPNGKSSEKAQKTDTRNARDHCYDPHVIVRGLFGPLLAVIRSQHKVEIVFVLVSSSFVLGPFYPTVRKIAEKVVRNGQSSENVTRERSRSL
jgi:hypothetical protein